MTAQIHERLIIDGQKTSMAFCPPLPKRHARVVVKRRESDEHDVVSTACWRRYQGTWEIRDGRLFLIGLAGRYTLLGSDPLFAEWFSGVLRVPRGEILEYVHMGFGSVFEEELHISIERGIVGESRVIDNRDKKHDGRLLGWQNLPGFENRFEGDGGPRAGSGFMSWLRRIRG